jgi:hypothetical protein
MSTPDPRLAEFSALRAEIINRSDAERALVHLNLTAAGALAGVAAANPGSAALMIVLPFLSSALGLLFLDHERKIHTVARYIKTKLWDGWDPSWERWLDKHRKSDWWRLIEVPMPTMLIFLGPAIAGLVVAYDHQSDFGGATVWWLALAATAWFMIAAAVGGLSRFIAHQFRE